MQEYICTNCNTKLLRKSQDGAWRLSGKVVKSLGEGTPLCVICRSCNTENILPITLTPLANGVPNGGGLRIELKKSS